MNITERDQLSQKYSTNGEYTVKSAYHAIMDHLLDNSHLKVKGNWKTIWNLVVPQRIKHFTWRLLRKCIPTRSNLRKKNILYPLHCVCCDSNIENEWHLFLACDHARLIWQAADLWNLAEHRWDNADNFHDFMFDFL